MKKSLICLLLAFSALTMFGCKDPASSAQDQSGHDVHTFEYASNSRTHKKQYTCGCPSDDVAEAHADENNDLRCDVCSYVLPETVNGLMMGTYYLPYKSSYDPVSITFEKNGRCRVDFANEKKEPYCCNYWILDGKVYMDIETDDQKVHVFAIHENALVFDAELSTANLWDSMANRGPVVYLAPDYSEEELLSTVYMAAMGLENAPEIERIYGKFKAEGWTPDVYAFMVNPDGAGEPWSDKILGTQCTFTYSDGREILIYTGGKLLSLNQAMDKGYVTSELVMLFNENHRNCEIAHSYDDGVITEKDGGGEDILYTCHVCGATKTVSLPSSFSFALTYGFDLKYDSETGHLENGYNDSLDQKCETTLMLDHGELMNIYRILYNGGAFEIKESFAVTDIYWVPFYNIKISYTVDGETVEFIIGGASYLTYSEWGVYADFAFAYETVVKDFILSSDEFKAMPPNSNYYD